MLETKRGKNLSKVAFINSLPWLLRLLGSNENTEAKSHATLIVKINGMVHFFVILEKNQFDIFEVR